MSDAICIGGFLAVSAAVTLFWLLRRGMLLRGLLFSAVTGLGSLWLVSLVAPVMKIGLTLNTLTGAVSVFFGIPGVVGMLLLNMVAV